MRMLLPVPRTVSRRARALWTARMVFEAARQPRFPFLPEAAIRQSQERRIRATVTYAHAHVPYYRETMRRLLLGPADFRSAADLARLPVIEREQLQRDPEYFLSERWPVNAYLALRSGGTTGAPVTVFRDPPSLLIEAGQRERLRSLVARLAGRRVRYREAAIMPEDSSVMNAVNALARQSLLPTSVRVQRRTFSMLRAPSELLPELEQYQPRVISSYGSYLEALFTHVRGRGHALRVTRVATYGGDGFSSRTRSWVQDELGIEVLGSYNAIEAPQIGFECEHHQGYHLNVDLCPVRLIGADGHQAVDGAEGEVVISNLVNRGTMLLNYRLGDLATLLTGPCRCGRTLPLCSYLGRTKAAWLDIGDGYTIHAQALRLVLRSERDIWRYQIVQETERRFLLRVVASPDCDREATSERLAERICEQLPAGSAVRTEFVADLPRAASGKVQPVVGFDAQ